jgi:hypothetical protein
MTMTINIQDLISILGYPMMSDIAQSVLRSNGFEPVYKPKKLKEYGSVFLEQKDYGIALDFCDRNNFESEHALPKEVGDAIFVGMFIYPNGSKDYKKFSFPIGFGIDGCDVRTNALKNLGAPQVTSEDNGIFEWDRWIVDGLSIRAEYSESQVILYWTIAVPYK